MIGNILVYRGPVQPFRMNDTKFDRTNLKTGHSRTISRTFTVRRICPHIISRGFCQICHRTCKASRSVSFRYFIIRNRGDRICGTPAQATVCNRCPPVGSNRRRSGRCRFGHSRGRNVYITDRWYRDCNRITDTSYRQGIRFRQACHRTVARLQYQ